MTVWSAVSGGPVAAEVPGWFRISQLPRDPVHVTVPRLELQLILEQTRRHHEQPGELPFLFLCYSVYFPVSRVMLLLLFFP